MKILLYNQAKQQFIAQCRASGSDLPQIALAAGHINRQQQAVVQKFYLPKQECFQLATSANTSDFLPLYDAMARERVGFLGYALWVPQQYPLTAGVFGRSIRQCGDLKYYIFISLNERGEINYKTRIER